MKSCVYSIWGDLDSLELWQPPVLGSAIAQAVSRRLPSAAARAQTRIWSCGIFWWTEVALGQVFSDNFGFPCQSTFHLLLHNHLHYHNRPGVAAMPIASQTKKKPKKNLCFRAQRNANWQHSGLPRTFSWLHVAESLRYNYFLSWLRNFLHFMEPEVSVQCSYELMTGLCSLWQSPIIFCSLSSLFWKKIKRRLMRSPCCLCILPCLAICRCIPTGFLGLWGLWHHLAVCPCIPL
jgi:hypothetical protein